MQLTVLSHLSVPSPRCTASHLQWAAAGLSWPSDMMALTKSSPGHKVFRCSSTVAYEELFYEGCIVLWCKRCGLQLESWNSCSNFCWACHALPMASFAIKDTSIYTTYGPSSWATFIMVWTCYRSLSFSRSQSNLETFHVTQQMGQSSTPEYILFCLWEPKVIY